MKTDPFSHIETILAVDLHPHTEAWLLPSKLSSTVICPRTTKGRLGLLSSRDLFKFILIKNRKAFVIMIS